MRFAILLSLCLFLPSNSAQGGSGIAYSTEEVLTWNPYIVSIDPRKNHVKIAVSENFMIPATPSQLARRHGAVVGINAGFFNFGDPGFFRPYIYPSGLKPPSFSHEHAFPDGMLKVKDRLIVDASNDVQAIGWKELSQTAIIGQLRVTWYLRFRDKDGDTQELQLLHRSSPTEIIRTSVRIFAKDDRITRIVTPGQASVTVPRGQNEYIIDPRIAQGTKQLQVGLRFEKYYLIEGDALPWQEMDYIVAGHPILVAAGKAVTSLNTGLNLIAALPRTGVCLLAGGRWKIVAMSQGISLPDFARVMEALNCTDAINLDGGISSSLFFSDVLLFPSASHERRVSDAIVVVPTEPEVFAAENANFGLRLRNEYVANFVRYMEKHRQLSLLSIVEDPDLRAELFEGIGKLIASKNSCLVWCEAFAVELTADGISYEQLREHVLASKLHEHVSALILKFPFVSSIDLKVVEDFPRLESVQVNLAETVSDDLDALIQSLAGKRDLTKVVVFNPPASEAELMAFSQLQQIKVLDLRRIKIPAMVLQRLKAALPQCEIKSRSFSTL